MSKRLKYKEFVPIGTELALGEQVHVDHDDCDAGVDNKRRLYIKRGDDDGNDVILAHCHHCGKSGYFREAYSRFKSHKKSTGSTFTSGSGSLPGDSEQDWGKWSGKALCWVGRYGITQAESEHWELGYSKSHDRVVLPVRKASETVGYQLRSLNPKDLPKYSTTAWEKPLYWYSGKVNNTLVIVEDILSAIKCSRYCSSVALLSGGVNDKTLSSIVSTGHDNYIVFLDDDNRQIKKSQIALKNRLELVSNNVKIISDLGKDPKDCSDDELKEILSGI